MDTMIKFMTSSEFLVTLLLIFSFGLLLSLPLTLGSTKKLDEFKKKQKEEEELKIKFFFKPAPTRNPKKIYH